MKGLSTVLLSEDTTGCPRETELVRACQQKCLGAEERLYKHFYGYVMSVSLRYTSSRDEAQEITDDSFMKAFASIDKFDSKQPIKPWLRRIVINTAIDYHRKNKRYQHALAIECISVSVEEHTISQLTAEEMLEIICQLPDLLRITFNLYEIEGYNHQEIAQRLGISESSSRVYLTRAKQRLRALYQRYWGEHYGRKV